MKLRRILGLVLAMLMLATCVCFTANADDATAKVVYVNGEFEEDDGDGLSTRKPFNNFQKAVEAVKDGGTIVVCGDTTFTILPGEKTASVTTPITGDVVITSVYNEEDYGATLTFDGYTYFPKDSTGSIKFENLKVWQTTNWNPTYFNGISLEIGENVACTNADGLHQPMFVLGGDGGGNGVAGGNIVVRSGNRFRSIVLACGRNPAEVNDINLEYYGGAVKFYVGYSQASSVKPNYLNNVNALIEAQVKDPEYFLNFTNVEEIKGAVQLVMNNGAAVEYILPEGVEAAGGLFIINSKKGGRVDFTETAGTFKVSSTEYTYVSIASEEGEIYEYELEVDGEECYAIVELPQGTYSVSYYGDAPSFEEYVVVMETVNVYKNNHNISYNGEIIANAKDGYKLANGTEVPFSINYEGTNYLPARKLSEILGITIGYNADTRAVLVDTLTANETNPTDGIVKDSALSGAASVSVAKNSVKIKVDGQTMVRQDEDFITQSGTLVPCSLIYEGTTYLPVRKLSELLGVTIGYDAETGTVLIGE